MAGHIITSYFKSVQKYEIINIDIIPFDETTLILDVFDRNALKALISKELPDVVINCIGVLIQASEEHPDIAIYLNSYFPHYLEHLGNKYNYKLIHMSTDCVFSGDAGDYTESDAKDGLGYYASSKALGEIVNEKDLTFRMSIIGPEIRENGSGLLHWFLTQKKQCNGYKNVFWTGITTLELAKAMDAAIEENLCGLYHLIPEKKISKFDLLNVIKNIWNKEIEILEDLKESHDKSLKNTRTDFNFKVKDYPLMLQELKNWMETHYLPQYKIYFQN